MTRIDRAVRRLASQDRARANAAEATDRLRCRRREQEEVDAYLSALHPAVPATGLAASASDAV
jgi:hypothetical protein